MGALEKDQGLSVPGRVPAVGGSQSSVELSVQLGRKIPDKLGVWWRVLTATATPFS